MLILPVVALGPIHGYGLAVRLQQIPNDVLQVQPFDALPTAQVVARPVRADPPPNAA